MKMASCRTIWPNGAAIESKLACNALAWSLAIATIWTAACSRSDSQSSAGSQGGTTASETISRSDAISEHWDDVKEYLNGNETVDACSSESGGCYNLEADIHDGEITEIHFNNGGHLSFSAEIDESGDASDSDENGNSWNFTLDMNSSIVDDAVDEWAKANDYTIQ